VRDRDAPDRHRVLEPAGDRVDMLDEKRRDTNRHVPVDHDAEQRARQRDQLEQRRQHHVAGDASGCDLLKVQRRDRRGGERDEQRRDERTHEPALPLGARRRDGEHDRGDERELEARIEEVRRPPPQHADRGDADRIERAQRAIERGTDHDQHDHDERAHGRDLRAGDERVRDGDRECGQRGPARRPDAPAERQRREQAAQHREREARDHREVQAAHAEDVKDADGAPARVERLGDRGAIAGHDAAQRGARLPIAAGMLDASRPRRLRVGGPAHHAIDAPRRIGDPLDAERGDLERGAAGAHRGGAIRLPGPEGAARRLHAAEHRDPFAVVQRLVRPDPNFPDAMRVHRALDAIDAAVIEDHAGRHPHRHACTACRAGERARDRQEPPDASRGDQKSERDHPGHRGGHADHGSEQDSDGERDREREGRVDVAADGEPLPW
jgi:hypothetical protein